MREVEESWRVAPEHLWAATWDHEFHVERTFTLPRPLGNHWDVYGGDRLLAIFFDEEEAHYYADLRNDDRREGGKRV